jgi:hypothetical protein
MASLLPKMKTQTPVVSIVVEWGEAEVVSGIVAGVTKGGIIGSAYAGAARAF